MTIKAIDGHEYPHRIRLQAHAHERIRRNSLKTKKTRGFGSGKGAHKGSKRKVPHMVREVLHSANLMLEQFDREEVVRYLAAIKLANPDLFAKALRQAPRTQNMDGIRIKPAKLIRPDVLNPTLDDIAKANNTTIETVEYIKGKNILVYDRMRFNAVTKLLTQGEYELLRLLQFRQVKELSDQLAADAVLASTRRRTGALRDWRDE